MSGQSETLWDAPQHTLAKLEILKRYLGAWFAIIGKHNPRILYIDGFAGPGEYRGGEDGSPAVAVRLAKGHKANIVEHTEVVCYFIERDPRRLQHLQNVMDSKFKPLPNNLKIYYSGEEFESFMGRVFLTLDQNGRALEPAFVFIDPFGWTGATMETMHRILGFQKTEVLFTFMYDWINRWSEYPNQSENMTALFGEAEWIRMGHPGDAPEARKEFLLRHMIQSMGHGARYVLPFEMTDVRNHTPYFLLHASNDLTAVAKMKETMWRVDPSGQFTFSDRRNPNQIYLFTDKPDYEDVRMRLVRRFSGHTVKWEEIREFILVDTPYCDGHFNTYGLSVLEKSSAIEVLEPPGMPRQRRRFKYPEDLRPDLRFRFK